MGIYDRDYYQRKSLPRGGFGYFSAWSVTTWLIVLNIVVFLVGRNVARFGGSPNLDELFGSIDPDSAEGLRRLVLGMMNPVERWGHFSLATAVYSGQVWRFVTFQFLHSSTLHLLGNMVGLYFFGPIVEAHFGRRRYLAFYLLCGLAAPLTYVILSLTHVIAIEPWQPLIGASSGVFGLLVAAAMIAPDAEVFSIVMPVTVGTLAIVGLLLAAFAVFESVYAVNAGGPQAAHLGGGVVGFVLMKNQHWLNVFARGRHRLGWVGVGRRGRVGANRKDWSRDFNR